MVGYVEAAAIHGAREDELDAAARVSFREFFRAKHRTPWPGRVGDPFPLVIERMAEAVADYVDRLARGLAVDQVRAYAREGLAASTPGFTLPSYMPDLVKAAEASCPVCSGDCSAANPPLAFCPMRPAA